MFESVLGHENEKQILKHDIEAGKVSHAYVFFGEEGIGKKKLAIEFAKKILNTEKLETCVDFRYIEKQEEKKDIVIEQIRDKLVNDIYIAPAMSSYKVYIIDDAHKMNLATQNTLLKTLEEPPHYVVIILVTSNIKGLIGTVLSRTKNILFSRLDDEQVTTYLAEKEGQKLDNNKIKYANGSIKTAINVSKQDGENIYQQVDELFKNIRKRDLIGSMQSIEKVDIKNEESLNYLMFLLMEEGLYSKVKHVNISKKRINQNGNEDIIKQTLCIKLLK